MNGKTAIFTACLTLLGTALATPAASASCEDTEDTEETPTAMNKSVPLTDGNAMENPVVNAKETSTVKSKFVQLTDEGGEVAINLGDKLWYCGNVQASICSDYTVEYDEEAFDLECTVERMYLDGDSPYECGGDRCDKMCELTPKKPGDYVVKIVQESYEEPEQVITYKVTVR